VFRQRGGSGGMLDEFQSQRHKESSGEFAAESLRFVHGYYLSRLHGYFRFDLAFLI